MNQFERWLLGVWYDDARPPAWLRCLSALFKVVVRLRLAAYRSGLLPTQRLACPVIVIGNISVGGTGKSPLVIWMTEHLRDLGFEPGIVSRGYGGKARSWPQLVTPASEPDQVGDEAVMLAWRTAAPVAVGPDRPAAARALVQTHGCNVIVSDDGLQHARLERDVEIVVVDGVRRHGNGCLLPAGPLRELPSRLDSVDLVVANGEAREREFSMRMCASTACKLDDPGTNVDLAALSGRKVRAVCGIGNPDRFFDLLRAHGIDPITSAFPDHHPFSAQDFDLEPALPVLMTEKDAVKCRSLGLRDAWVVPVSAQLPTEFVTRLDEILQPLRSNTRTEC